MAADRSFTSFLNLVLRTVELPHNRGDQKLPMSRRNSRSRLNAMDVFNDRESVARNCLPKATVTRLLKSRSPEECEKSQRLPVPSMPYALDCDAAIRRWHIQAHANRRPGKCVATRVCRIIGRLSRLIASTLCHRVVKCPGIVADLVLVK